MGKWRERLKRIGRNAQAFDSENSWKALDDDELRAVYDLDEMCHSMDETSGKFIADVLEKLEDEGEGAALFSPAQRKYISSLAERYNSFL